MRTIVTILCVLSTLVSLAKKKQDSIVISNNSGLYTSSFQLILSNNGSEDILFSLDGTYPKVKYSNSIEISNTTTLRCRIKNTSTEWIRNFIFLNRKQTLPVVCLTVSPSDLFDSTYGIYAKGRNAQPDPPYLGANFHKDWERKGYIEFIDTNNNVKISQYIGLKIFGQFSAMLPQKSFSIHARKKYGNKRINYKVFGDLPYKKYKSIILRNSGSDYCNSHFRDIMMTSLVKSFNLDVQAYQPSIVFLNGEYWGLYHLREKINEHFIKLHYNVDKDSIAILKHRGDVQHYGRVNYKSMLRFISKTDFSSNKQIDSLSKLMDIDNYLDYNIAQVYFNNIDAGGNIRYWRHRKDGSVWRWILFDTDFGFGLRKGNDVDENTLLKFTTKSSEKWPSPAWSTLIIRKLLENDSIKNIYIKKITYYLNTTFSPYTVKNHIYNIEKKLSDEMPFHFKRWKRRINIWEKEKKVVYDFGLNRATFMKNHMRIKFDLDTFYSLKIKYNEGGKVRLDEYEVETGYNGYYFKNYPHSIRAIPDFGYSLRSWKGNLNSTNTREILNVSQPSTIVGDFIKNPESAHKGHIYFNEICTGDSLLSSYIELYNDSNENIDISEWILRKDSTEVYKIPKGVFISANDYLTIFMKKGSYKNYEFPGLFKIKKSSFLELYTKKEQLVQSIQLSKKLFKKSHSIEFVKTPLNSGWESSKNKSFNKENQYQTEAVLEYKILRGIVIFILSIVTFLLIRFSFVKIKRLRGATE